MLQSGDDEFIRELCTANGLCYEKVTRDGSVASSLEMLFSGFSRMVGLSLFPRLCQLTVVGQAVALIQGLEACPLLQELWVAECQLTEISGLQTCVQLQKLYLYDNKISKIENLDKLENLEVLWLSNNCIALIEGLDTLWNLRELNLADNAIERVEHSLDPNINLQNLNLSGNKISSLKELTSLARLPALKELGLMDPQYGTNPVCLLCNYATHLLYHMPGLQQLDTYDVSSRLLKDTAEATVMKKMMYYNMRVKRVQGQLAETEARLLQHKKRLLLLPEKQIWLLSHTIKHVERELAEVQVMPGTLAHHQEAPSSPPKRSVDRSAELKLLQKLDALKERLRLWMSRLEEVEIHHQAELSIATERKNLVVHFLVMELETVGNIHFEEGSSTDPWFTSCCDLILSRFCTQEQKAHGIAGVKVTRVIRLHNRALRLRFEDKLHALLANEDSADFSQNPKRWLDYLFYLPDGETDKLLHIMEDGFPPACEAAGKDRAVALSSSLSVSERPGKQQGQNPRPSQHDRVIVAKVFLGRSLPAREGDPIEPDSYPKAHSVYHTVTMDTHPGGAPMAESSSMPHPSCECGFQQKKWFVFDHELVLPEYLVDFEYITQDRHWTALPELTMSNQVKGPPVFQQDIDLDRDALNMEPGLQLRPKIMTLDEKAALTMARASVLGQITILNLHGNSLRELKGISQLMALRHLTVSFNELTHLGDLSHMPSLEFVDASYNRITTLESFRGMKQLRRLDLRWNKLTRVRPEAAGLCQHAPCLQCLDICHNPWHKPGMLRLVVLSHLRTLTHLDGQLVSEEEVAAATQMCESRIDQVSILAHSQTDTERPRRLSLLSTAQLLTKSHPTPWDLSAGLEEAWTLKITALNLDGQRLSRLENLEGLVNLQWASFNNNNITDVEGLQNCRQLKELSLDDNDISGLDGLSRLHQLTRLSMNRNRLSSLDTSIFDELPNLHSLSMESNLLSSLRGMQRARSLFEVYLGNNRISATRDIYYLKALASLIVLDLQGNPLVAKQENYRMYVVFQLPSLKALDGLAVEMSESESAKDIFGGRLTPDMVVEKLGHANYSQILELDLQGSSIRMVDLAPFHLFRSLRSINLMHNNLTSFSGLIYLPKIKVLYLNYNRIESILPQHKSPVHPNGRQTLYHKVSSSGYGQQNLSRANRDARLAENLEPLMESLEVLHLGHNGISSLASLQLSRLTGLRALFLQGNEISHVEGLEGLQHLRELALDGNRIRAMGQSSFSGQTSLVELHLAENRLREVDHLQPLVKLRRLFLDANKLQDLSEIEKLEELPSLVELSVLGNPVARRTRHRPAVLVRLTRLQVLDGLAVTLEEKAWAEMLLNETECGVPGSIALESEHPGHLTLPSHGSSAHTGILQHFLGSDLPPSAYLEDKPARDSAKHRRRHICGLAPPPQHSIHRKLAPLQPSGPLHVTALLSKRQQEFLPYANVDGGFQNHGASRRTMQHHCNGQGTRHTGARP
ncbi:leucine-rich repeat-containing protein 9 [Brienomyrus brachyistius]|uniref:leucine-rich repeat-containing protein 9 n=1 Tax=Brienomyrus brachyistius TaxID=42636 RepID=UPI0020B22BF3|nr:leucine-rich repeat-containing protein 9 [Brienomyrus brachyistius]XP_048830996.1 leucine-rich repeat-containing protein 9 [Brienomyrus brachyistius]